MKSKLFLLLYSGWVLWWLAITYFDVGDAGVPGHIWLVITGFPLSLVSLLLPHGLLSSVLAAGILGAIQWWLLLVLFNRNGTENETAETNIK